MMNISVFSPGWHVLDREPVIQVGGLWTARLEVALGPMTSEDWRPDVVPAPKDA